MRGALFPVSRTLLGSSACRRFASSAVKPAADGAKSPSTEEKVFDVTDDTFDEKVMQGPGTVIVDAYADWCGPCRALAPKLTAAVKKTPNVRLAKLDVDTNHLIADRLRVNAIPAVFAFNQGKLIAQFVGVPEEEKLNLWVTNVSDPEMIEESLRD